MFVSKTAFTSDRPIPLAISFDIPPSPHHDFSRSRTPGDSENPLSDAGVSGENLPPLAERPPPGKRRISCCRRPRPGSVRQGGRRSFSRRYRLMITLPGQRSTTSLKTFWSRRVLVGTHKVGSHLRGDREGFPLSIFGNSLTRQGRTQNPSKELLPGSRSMNDRRNG